MEPSMTATDDKLRRVDVPVSLMCFDESLPQLSFLCHRKLLAARMLGVGALSVLFLGKLDRKILLRDLSLPTRNSCTWSSWRRRVVVIVVVGIFVSL